MKNLIVVLLSAILAITVVSCGGGKQAPKTDAATNTSVTAETNAGDTNVTIETPTEEVKAADAETKAAVKNQVEADSGQAVGLE